jgi:hypothetical protein
MLHIFCLQVDVLILCFQASDSSNAMLTSIGNNQGAPNLRLQRIEFDGNQNIAVRQIAQLTFHLFPIFTNFTDTLFFGNRPRPPHYQEETLRSASPASAVGQ